MQKIKNYIKLILQIFFFISIFNQINAKNLDKYYQGDKISNYFSGIISLRNSDYRTSYKYFKQLSGLENKHSSYSSYYQHSLINLKKFEEAFSHSKKMENLKVDNFESNLIIGIYHLKQENFEKAKKYFQKLKKSNQKNLLSIILSESLNAWAEFDKLSKDDAVKRINSYPKGFGNIKKIQSTFLACYFDSENINEEFEKITLDKKVNFSRYNFFYANYLFNNGEKVKAINIIDRALDLYPRNLILRQLKNDIELNGKTSLGNQFECKKINHVLAEIFYVTSNALAAESLFAMSNFYLNLAIYLNPNFISFKTLLAENFYLTKSYKNSNKIYYDIKRGGKVYNWHASKQIAKILTKNKKEKKGLVFLTKEFKAIKNPNPYQIYDFATFLKNSEKFKEAILLYNKVLEKVDNKHSLYSSVLEGRGVSYERLGKWERGEKDLLASLKSLPNQAYVINYLAYSWIEKGKNIEKSLEMLKKASELKKNDGYILDSLGWAYFKLQNYTEAQKYLQLAVQIMPYDPVINDHYADALWMNNKKIQARYFWEYVLNLEKVKQEEVEVIKKN